MTLGLLDADNPHLGHLLDMTKDPEHLWSPFGILSLSKADSYFGQDENYWRGPVWVHMNYLALQALHTVGDSDPSKPSNNVSEIRFTARAQSTECKVNLQRTALQPDGKHAARVPTDWLCVGTVQCRDRKWTEEQAIHRLVGIDHE